MKQHVTRLVLLSALLTPSLLRADGVTFNARTANSGKWSDAATWENGRAPRAGDFVQIRPGHVVVYDVDSAAALRMVHVGGTLTFARDKSTRLDVGLLKIQPGNEANEDGFVCSVHPARAKEEKHNPHQPAPDAATDAGARAPESPRPALEVGTVDDPIPAGVTATIRLVRFDGTDPDTLPALVDCGGRMDLHGGPMNRTWVKLGKPAKEGDDTLTLAEPVTGWKPGDFLIVTASGMSSYYERKNREGKGPRYGTEERRVKQIDGTALVLDKPLDLAHAAGDEGRCEVADLSRNVVIESADASGPATRGHTMYHRNSTGGISYAEFRHLGKRGLLGKYPVHFHLLRDGMRSMPGSGQVIGASIWDSGNRFMAVHGTDYLLVRDCVGYRSVGHGFFLEDATEQYNILDRNLAVRCGEGKPLPDQALPFDQNEGAGFWWANGRNTLTRNVACENDRYGFRFDINKLNDKPPVVDVKNPEGKTEPRDARAIPFLRFEDNESHSEGLYSFDFGDDPDGAVHGDARHPFITRDLRAWSTHYALRPSVSYYLAERVDINDAVYGVYHPSYDAHVYRDLHLNRVSSEPINRGHDDESIQSGSFTYDGLKLENCRTGGNPIIQLTCTSPKAGNSGHFRDLTVTNCQSSQNVVDLGGGPRNDKLENGVPYYFHESAGGVGKGRAVKVVSVKFPGLMTGGEYRSIPNWTGPDVRAAEVEDVPFPKLLDPIDDLPPATIITSVRTAGGKLIVRGVSEDDGEVASVSVNGAAAKIVSQHAGVAEWEAALDAAGADGVTAAATDKAGNVEKTPARVRIATSAQPGATGVAPPAGERAAEAPPVAPAAADKRAAGEMVRAAGRVLELLENQERNGAPVTPDFITSRCEWSRRWVLAVRESDAAAPEQR